MAGNIKGITVEIGGNTMGLQKALSDVNTQSRNLASEMREVDRALKFDPTNTELLAQKQEILSKQIENTSEKLQSLKSVQEQVENQFASGDIGEEQYRAFQREVINTESYLKSLEQQQNELSSTDKETTEATEKNTAALKENGETADNAGDKFSKLKSVVGTVGKVLAATTAAIGTAAVAAGKQLIDMANDTAAAGDAIDKSSQAAGMSAETYQQWSYVLERNGASADSLATWMKKLNNNVDDAANGSATAVEKFERLGISVDDLKGKSREEVFSKVITELQGMKDESERAAAVNDLLGGSATDLGALLNSTAEDTQALKDNAKALGLVMSNEAVANSAAYEDALTDLKGSLGGVKKSISAELLPGLTEIMQGFTGLITGSDGAADSLESGAKKITDSINEMLPNVMDTVTDMIDSISEIAGSIIETLVNGIIECLPSFIELASKMINSFISGILQALPSITEGAVKLVTALVNGIIKNLPMIFKAATEAVSTLVKGLTDSIPKIVSALANALPDIIIAITDFLTASIPTIIQAGLELLISLVGALPEIINSIIAVLPQIITSIVNSLLSCIPQIIQAGINLLTALVGALPEIINAIVAVIPQIIDGIVNALLANLPQIIQAGIDLITALINDLPTIINTIVAAIPQIISAVVDTVVAAIPQLINAGVELFIALVDNLPAIITGICDAIPQIIDGIVNSLDTLIPRLIEAGINLFVAIISDLPTIIAKIVEKIPEIINSIVDGFSSLGTKMLDIGKNMIEGLWNGISNAASWLWDNISGWCNDLWGGICSFFGIQSPSRLMRDTVGNNLALGIGEGFIDTMDDVNQDMIDSIPTSFDVEPDINSVQVANSSGNNTIGNSGFAFYLNIDNFNNYTNNDLESIMNYASQYFSAQMERREVVF